MPSGAAPQAGPRPRSHLLLAALAGALAVALLAAAALRTTPLAFTLGVAPVGEAAALAPAQEACQAPIVVPPDGGFDRVAFAVGTGGRPGPRLAVTVRALDGRPLASGTLAAGYPDRPRAGRHRVRVAPVAEGRRVSVCVANRGAGRAVLYGNGGAASRSTSAALDGRPLPFDLDFTFERAPRSLAALAPAMARRAALFSAGFAGAWTSALAVALALLVPLALLALALRSAERERTRG